MDNPESMLAQLAELRGEAPKRKKVNMKALEAQVSRIAYCYNCNININASHSKGLYIGIPSQKTIEGKNETVLTPLCARCGFQYLITLSNP